MKAASKAVIAVWMVLSLLLIGGCGFKDIDKRFFVVSIGVDLAKNSPKKYRVSLKFAIPPTKDKPSDSEIISEDANSMSEAVRIIKTKVDREIDFSHTKVIVYGEELIKHKGNAGINYWFARRRDIQQIAWMAIGSPSAQAVLKVQPKSETLPSNALFLSMGKDGSETPYVIPQFLFDLKRRLIERGLDPILPIVEAKKDIFEIKSVGLLDKSHMKIRLTPDETKLLNFLMNREKKSAVIAQKGEVKYVVNTEKVKTSYKIITPKGKQPYIKVNYSVTGTIEETNRRITNEELAGYEREAEREGAKKVKAVLEKIQKAGIDPIGFGLRYRSRHFNNNDWDEWQHIYPQVKFVVNSRMKITDTGLLQ